MESLKNFLIDASFQTVDNQFRNVQFTMQASGGQQIWDALQEMCKDDGSYLVRSKIMEVDAATGALTPCANVSALPKLLPAPEEDDAGPEPRGEIVPEKRDSFWYLGDEFGAVNIGVTVSACTYKTEDSANDSDT